MGSDNSKLYVELLPDSSSNTGLSLTNGDYEEFRKIAVSTAGYTYENKNIKRNNNNAVKNSNNQFFDINGPDFGKVPLVCDKVYPLYY